MTNLTIGHLIDQTWEEYRAKFRELISISAWLLIPGALSVVALALYPGAVSLITNRPIGALDITAMIIWILSNQIALPIISLWIFIVTIKFLQSRKTGQTFDFKKAGKESWKIFVPVVWINLLVGLVIFSTVLFLVPGGLINFLGVRLDNAIIAKIGGLILILSVLATIFFTGKFTVQYAFAPLSVIINGRRGREALTESRELAKGSLMRILVLRIFSVLVFGVIIFAIVSLINSGVSFITTSIAGLNIELAAKLSGIQSSISTTLTLVLFYPIFYVLEFVLFDSLRKK